MTGKVTPNHSKRGGWNSTARNHTASSSWRMQTWWFILTKIFAFSAAQSKWARNGQRFRKSFTVFLPKTWCQKRARWNSDVQQQGSADLLSKVRAFSRPHAQGPQTAARRGLRYSLLPPCFFAAQGVYHPQLTDWKRVVIIPRDAISDRLERHADFDEGWLTAHIAECAMSSVAWMRQPRAGAELTRRRGETYTSEETGVALNRRRWRG